MPCQSSTTLSIRAPSRKLHEFTDSVGDFVAESGIREDLLTIFCRNGRPKLGTWQGIFEHRLGTPEREIALHLISE